MIAICPDVMTVNTCQETFKITDIEYRRFLYHAGSGLLILGRQAAGELFGLTYQDEVVLSGSSLAVGKFTRGWISCNSSFPYGLVHFTPYVDPNFPERFSDAVKVIKMFLENGAGPETVIRGFGDMWGTTVKELNMQRV